MSGDTPDLSFVTTDELVEELRKRHDSMIFAYNKSMGDDEDVFGMWYYGGRFTAIGIAEKVKHNLIDLEARDEKGR